VTVVDRLREVPLFGGLAAEDLARICSRVTEISIAAGDVLFAEGETAEQAYVIVSGEVEVLKETERRETLLAVRTAGDVIGEMALLRQEPRMATVRARSDAELLCIPKAALDGLLDTSPSAARAMFTTLLDRWQETNDQLKHNERMVQLGTLTAGVAHELNNPAAAVKRSAGLLAEALEEYRSAVASAELDASEVKVVGEVASHEAVSSLSAMERADREEEIEDWLEARGVPEPWQRAATIVDGGVDIETLQNLEDQVGRDRLIPAIAVVSATSQIRRLVAEIGEGAGRLSDIVGALKSYSYLDQAPVQDVDVVQGIEDTVLLLGHKLKGIEIVREFDPVLATITAYGSELNQVWTNLLDNAADAVSDVDDPAITLRTMAKDDEIIVEVEDNGAGILSEHKSRIFDSFFTTKPPGEGTGLGLQITHRIVVLDHRGAIEVDSVPGRTTFRVILPISQPTQEDP